MRIFRNKQNRKTLAFFRINYKVYQPYRVLLDGNFVAHAERLKMEWRRLLPKLLQVEEDQCHFHITECVLAELASLGPEFAPVVAAARALPLLKCRKKHGHSHEMDASACFTQLVGPENAGKWVVVTQDADLRTALRAVPGTPLALLSNNVLVLEPPSNNSRHATAEAEAGKVVLSKEEAKAVRAATSALSAAGVASAAGGSAAGAGAGAPKRDVVGSLQPRFKHHAAGPNPLSMQKKKKRGEGGGGGGGGGGDEDGASTIMRKRRRKERKGAVAAAGARPGGSEDGGGSGSGGES